MLTKSKPNRPLPHKYPLLTEALTKILQEVATVVYQQAAAAQQAQQAEQAEGGAAKEPKENVVDAEYEEVDKDKKE